MGSIRVYESELHATSRERLQSHEELELFLQMRKGSERERKYANSNPMPDDWTLQDYESVSCFDAGPIEAGSALEAHVAARLSSSSIYRSSKPILRYASKRSNADLLTYDAEKTDFDWLITPPATPLMKSFDDANSGNGEGSIAHMLATASQELGDKFLSPKSVASILLDDNKLDRSSASTAAAACTDWQEGLIQESHANNHAKSGISLSSPRGTNKTTQNGLTISHMKGTAKALSKSKGEVSLHGANAKTSINGSSYLTSNKTTKTATSTSRFSAPPSIKTNMKESSNSHQIKKNGPITLKMAATSNAKQTTISKTPSKRPTTPTLRQSQPPESTAKPRSTSIGRGAIHVSGSNNTNKQSKGSRSTSSSRVGSPEAKSNAPQSLPWESLEMPEAPPNLRTTIPKRSTSTTRGPRQPTTPTQNGSNSSSSGKNANRSVSATRGRSTSTTRSVSSSTSAVALTTSRGNNNKGTSNGNVLGSKMVDKVVQARRVAASPSTSSSLLSPSPKSPALSMQSSASSTFSIATSKSVSSSSLSISSPSSVKSFPSISSVSSSSSLLEFSNKGLSKPGLSNLTSINLDSTLDFTSSKLSQMSKENPMQRSKETQQLEPSNFQAYPSNNNENNMRHTVVQSKNTQALKNFNTMASILMEKQKPENLDHQHHFRNTSEDSSDFSNELNAIMRQDRVPHYYSAFPPRDIIKVNNNWMMNSPDSMRNDSVEFMHLFTQGIEGYGVSESPLVCQHGALSNCERCKIMSAKGVRGFKEVWKPSPLSGNLGVIHKNPHELWKGSPY